MSERVVRIHRLSLLLDICTDICGPRLRLVFDLVIQCIRAAYLRVRLFFAFQYAREAHTQL